MTVYFRSSSLVITGQLLKVRVPNGWRVWVIADLTDFGIAHSEARAERRSWGLGWSALVVVALAGQLKGSPLLIAGLLLILACAWLVNARRHASRRLTSQLWARRKGARVLLFELPNRDFDAACRALRRVLERREDESHDRLTGLSGHEL